MLFKLSTAINIFDYYIYKVSHMTRMLTLENFDFSYSYNFSTRHNTYAKNGYLMVPL